MTDDGARSSSSLRFKSMLVALGAHVDAYTARITERRATGYHEMPDAEIAAHAAISRALTMDTFRELYDVGRADDRRAAREELGVVSEWPTGEEETTARRQRCPVCKLPRVT